MKKFYLSFVTICLIFSATAPLPVTVYAETNSPEEISPNNTEEKPTQEGSTTSSTETNEKKTATADKTNEETTNASNTAADTSSPKKETTPDTKTTTPSPKEKAATNQLLAAGDTYIDTFPDEAFAKVIALQITGSNDTSQVVTQEQLDAITSLNASGKNITDVTGINQLTNLTTIDLSQNQLTSIEPITNLTALTSLNVSNNLLRSVVITTVQNLPNLTSLNISNNPTITKLSIADQAKLTSINASIGGVHQSALEELTLSNLPALTQAGGSTSSANSVTFSNYSDVLTTVKLNGLPKIQCVYLQNNLIDDIDVHDMAGLTDLYLDSNELTEINNLQDVPLLNNINVDNNHIAVLPTNLETQVPNLKTLSAGSQTISLPTQIVSEDLSVANGISNNGVISAPTTISNSGAYQDGNVNWVYDDIKSLSSVSYNFSEPVNYSGVAGTFSGTVTQPIKVSLAPVITAEYNITYPKFSTVTEAEFLTDIQASTSDDSSITSDFETVVDFSTPGDYTVTLNSENEDGVPATPVTVMVTVEKDPAPIITADSKITYMKHSTITSAEFLTGIHATTNDGSPITSDFETVVDFETAGDYTVTLQSVNSDGVAATPVTVTVHVEKASAPIITADREISYPEESKITAAQFYKDIHAITNDGSTITSDFDTVVNFAVTGDYTVTLQAINSDGVAADPVKVIVHVTANEPTPTPTPPTPPNNGNNSGNNTGNTNNPTSKSGSNTSLPSTGDTTTGSSAGILLLLIACSLLYASRKNKHTDKK
ncbi:LapB repeat-containing protein [Listeria seeligeri]|uniref:LapB repeat-containing protein n=1 Tax=Listeria seeligeri TaxID=1640 RepID=UPI001628805C|nr:LapB repeat-containing protein [Listeria seeligeri]MBC2019228.1 LapB repeat-containing protein [Listeria seeligeri]